MTTAAPTRVTSIELAADTLTPVAAALRLGARCAFLLESVEGGARYGRYSIAGVHGRTLVVAPRIPDFHKPPHIPDQNKLNIS